jgi:hypothetical protein
MSQSVSATAQYAKIAVCPHLYGTKLTANRRLGRLMQPVMLAVHRANLGNLMPFLQAQASL